MHEPTHAQRVVGVLGAAQASVAGAAVWGIIRGGQYAIIVACACRGVCKACTHPLHVLLQLSTQHNISNVRACA